MPCMMSLLEAKGTFTHSCTYNHLNVCVEEKTNFFLFFLGGGGGGGCIRCKHCTKLHRNDSLVTRVVLCSNVENVMNALQATMSLCDTHKVRNSSVSRRETCRALNVRLTNRDSKLDLSRRSDVRSFL